MRRTFLLPTMLTLVMGSCAHAQVVKKKNLLISLGGGASYGTLASTRAAYSAKDAWGGNITFGFAYAFNANWGLGIRYDRLGYTSSYDTLAQARASLVHLHGTYRPWQTDVHALEIETGIGASLISMRGRYERIPAEASAYALNVSVRYLRTLRGSIVAFLALRGSTVGTAALHRGEEEITTAEGRAAEIGGRACWFNAGLAVRW
ncbi:MAG: hypothetical protein ABI599_17680 [Flavobacteriales bacterium]